MEEKDKLSLEKLVELAQTGDKAMLNEIIQRFQGYIFKKCVGMFIKDYDIEDLIQIGNVSIMKAVEKFDTSKDKQFLPYVTTAIQCNYYYLIRGKARYEAETSLNKENSVGEELLQCFPSDENIEDSIIKKEEVKFLKEGLCILNSKEKEFIDSIFYKRTTITKYAQIHNMNYCSCVRFKNKTLKKLKKYIVDTYNYKQ